MPDCTFAVAGDTLTEMTGVEVSVIVTELNFVGSRFEIAVRVTEAGLGSVTGAVYVTEVVPPLSEPQAGPVQPVPESDHVTPRLPGSLLTVALNPWFWPIWIVAELGKMPTETAAITVTLADAERVVSATDVAVTVTPAPGIVAGAV
jgi:hypothetical protein